MKRLSDMTISTKLNAILAFALCLCIGISSLGIMDMKARMLEDRKVRTKQLVETAYTLIEYYYTLSIEGGGQLPDSEAREQAKQAVSKLRYNEKEYFWINDSRPYMVMHPYKPELNGKDLSQMKDPKGKLLFVEFVKTVQKEKDAQGFVSYMWPAPGAPKETEPIQKISFVKLFKPWGWIVGSGIYIQDVNESVMDAALTLSPKLAVLFALMLVLCLKITKDIRIPIMKTTQTMEDLAQGNTTLTIEGTERKDEIGTMAKTLDTFRTALIRQKELAERERTLDIEKQQRAKRLNETVEQFNIEIHSLLNEFSSNGSLEDDISSSGLNSSINEVNQHVLTTQHAINDATQKVDMTMNTVSDLVTSAQKIGEITKLINSITSKTNLLALNATIEAARAGDAGKGFSVVANEVKTLANQTANATEEITQQIHVIQNITATTENAVDEINQSINVVAESAECTKNASQNVLDSSGEILEWTMRIRTSIEKFLDRVKTA
ncbi:MAG: cache domain-containing protein [Pseudobdellovibrionaceae bacterium]|jgi:methyl-accepting chemotaxis protein|nr:cache domain-containing protein [Pseudobdellovibrionaceae bacterium]